jgi:hypothetical protein
MRMLWGGQGDIPPQLQDIARQGAEEGRLEKPAFAF